MAKFSPFREELRRAYRELHGSGNSPARGAAAVAIGIFVGTQPVFPLQTVLVIALCLWLRLDAFVGWVASNVSNPFFVAAILAVEVQLGAYLRTGERVRLDHALTGAGAIGGFAGDLFVGAPVFGGALAAVGFGITWGALTVARRLRPDARAAEPYRLPAGAPAWFHAVERVAGRYVSEDAVSAVDRSRFHYARTRLTRDHVARLVADVEGKAPGALGEVTDLGAGCGELAILLLELGRADRVRGVDRDARSVDAARRAAAAVGSHAAVDAEFSCGDAREAAILACDTVLLVDVLRDLAPAEQDALLRRAAAAVRVRGRVVVREIDTERGLRSGVTRVVERVIDVVRRRSRARLRPAREIAALLGEAGLDTEIQPAWGKTPLSHVLVIGRRRGQG